MLPVSRRVSNPPNPYERRSVDWLQDDELRFTAEGTEYADGDATPIARLEILEEDARSILSKNDSPDLAFRWSANPYRGCIHACAYCYARPTHQYLGFGAGTDFDRRIVVKRNAPELLEKRLRSHSWSGEAIVFSGVTDCYQAIERHYELTRRCLEVCVRHGNPVSIVTKSPLVVRDLDLLKQLPDVRVHMSIPFADDGPGRALEAFVAAPKARFRAMQTLADDGIRVGISIAPLIPGLNEHELPELLERAAGAGASQASLTLVRLPRETAPVFEQRLRASCPGQADKVLRGIRELRGGSRLSDARFGRRMEGQGPRWQWLTSLFDKLCRRHGLGVMRIGAAFEAARELPPAGPKTSEASPKARGQQGELFR